MAKRNQQPSERDPWEEPIERDPWEVDDAVPAPVPDAKPRAKRESKQVVPVTTIEAKPEERQMAATKETGDEWAIRYTGKEPTAQFEIDARKKRQQALVVLAQTGSPRKAALAVNLTPRALQLARKNHPDFDRNWELAKEIYHEFVAEEKIRGRAVDGVRTPIWYQGSICGYEIKYDSGLTQFWYKANMREKYGDQSEIKISGNVNHGIAILPARATNESEWEADSFRAEQQRKVIDITPVVVEDAKTPTKVTR